MPQNEYIEEAIKLHGKRLDTRERARKAAARAPSAASSKAQSTRGIKAKLLHARRYSEKVAMKRTIMAAEEKEVAGGGGDAAPPGAAVPAYLLDREGASRAKVLSNTVKQKRKEKAGKWAVPLPKVRPISDEEAFKAVVTGKKRDKSWKRMVTKATFVGQNFTRKDPKVRGWGWGGVGVGGCRVF